MQRTAQHCVELTAELLPGAERELAAFVRAVEERFGDVQARQSIEDWMEQLESMHWPEGGGDPDWRLLTIAASARLAARVNVQGLRRLSTAFHRNTRLSGFRTEIANP